jgi:dihydrofolate reductase
MQAAAAVELTEVHAEAEGDTFIPAFDPGQWREVSREKHAAEHGRPAFSFVRLVRAAPTSPRT